MVSYTGSIEKKTALADFGREHHPMSAKRVEYLVQLLFYPDKSETDIKFISVPIGLANYLIPNLS